MLGWIVESSPSPDEKQFAVQNTFMIAHQNKQNKGKLENLASSFAKDANKSGNSLSQQQTTDADHEFVSTHNVQ